jgi:hypothetical protein
LERASATKEPTEEENVNVVVKTPTTTTGNNGNVTGC